MNEENLIRVLETYKLTLTRKQNRIERLRNMKMSEVTINVNIEILILEAEVRQLKEFIDDLNFIRKGFTTEILKKQD